ncbi:MAG: cupin domain-containing protein [Rhodospirillales bacterium]|nr:cupin domain-containing protein [Rhodospirillales bacterium]MDH3967959.1 cupin domain-containing protein [Rhodospirillales bacterium]
MDVLSDVLRAERLGTTALIDRLGGVLFIQVIRSCVESLRPDQAGRLGAMVIAFLVSLL